MIRVKKFETVSQLSHNHHYHYHNDNDEDPYSPYGLHGMCYSIKSILYIFHRMRSYSEFCVPMFLCDWVAAIVCWARPGGV